MANIFSGWTWFCSKSAYNIDVQVTNLPSSTTVPSVFPECSYWKASVFQMRHLRNAQGKVRNSMNKEPPFLFLLLFFNFNLQITFQPEYAIISLPNTHSLYVFNFTQLTSISVLIPFKRLIPQPVLLINSQTIKIP